MYLYLKHIYHGHGYAISSLLHMKASTRFRWLMIYYRLNNGTYAKPLI